MNTEVPGYLFDLIKLSILSAEGNREAMAVVTEEAIGKGADSREIKMAMFRAEKMAQRTMADERASVQRGIQRLTLGDAPPREQRIPWGIKLLTSKKTI